MCFCRLKYNVRIGSNLLEYFKGRNFRGKKLSRMDKFAKFLHFARINFREWSSLTYFAVINFHESHYLWFTFFDLTLVFYRYLAVLCFVSHASSILPYVLFIIKKFNAYQWTRKTKHCLYLYPLWYLPVLNQKLEKFREFTVFHIFSREKTFANQPLQNFSRK